MGIGLLALIIIASVMFPWAPVNAHIVPSAGSYFLQMFLALLLGGLMAVKIFSGKIKFFYTPF